MLTKAQVVFDQSVKKSTEQVPVFRQGFSCLTLCLGWRCYVWGILIFRRKCDGHFVGIVCSKTDETFLAPSLFWSKQKTFAWFATCPQRLANSERTDTSRKSERWSTLEFETLCTSTEVRTRTWNTTWDSLCPKEPFVYSQEWLFRRESSDTFATLAAKRHKDKDPPTTKPCTRKCRFAQSARNQCLFIRSLAKGLTAEQWSGALEATYACAVTPEVL